MNIAIAGGRDQAVARTAAISGRRGQAVARSNPIVKHEFFKRFLSLDNNITYRSYRLFQMYSLFLIMSSIAKENLLSGLILISGLEYIPFI